MVVFKDNLALELKKNKMTQTELARKAGLSITAINKYLSGINIPSKKNLINIAQILNTTPHELLGKEVFNGKSKRAHLPIIDITRGNTNEDKK